jgi:hypothetical protein
MRNRAIGRVLAGLATTGVVLVATVAAFAQTPPGRTSALPPAVLRAFQQAYPGATISATAQQRDADRTLFRVDSVDKGRRRIVVYDTGGAVIEIAEQVDEKDLPKPVAAAMHSHPRAIYGTGMKVTRGGRVQYELTLRGTRKTAMIAKPDGTVVSFK